MKNLAGIVLLAFLILFNGPAHALTSGTTTTGSITMGGTDTQSFTGTAGQGIILYGNSANYTVRITVYKPDGTLWTAGNDRFLADLPATGTYSVVISAYNNPSASGGYSLAYLRGGDSVSNGTLSGGDKYNGTLATNGIESFQFSGTAGQAFALFSYSASFTPVIYIYKPDGTVWMHDSQRLQTLGTTSQLPSTGTYTVAILGYYSTNSGSYRVDFARGQDTVSNGTLRSGQSQYLTLAPNGIDSFEINANANDAVILFTGGAFTARITFYKPDGGLLNISDSSRYLYTMPTTGTYVVVIEGYSAANSGDYRIDYVKGNDDVSDGTLVTGKSRDGNLLVNGLVSYHFSGTASNSVTFGGSGSFTRRVYLFKPNGTYWGYYDNSLTTTLPAAATGSYNLIVSGYNAAWSGAYTVSVTTAAPSVPPSDPELDGQFCLTCNPDAGNMVSAGYSNDGASELAGGGATGATGLLMTGTGFFGAGGGASGPAGNATGSINFDIGYKKQVDTDYNAGGLNFTRVYRSDSTWTDNTVGTLWRHNYARTLVVTGTTATITDATGAVTSYTLSGSNWVPDAADTMATFQTVGSTYVYTLPNNTVERYNSSKQLVRIEFLGGGALNLGYNGSGQLTSVTNENGRSLTLTYSGGKVATLVTPDGTYSYSYTSGNLTTVTKPDTKTVVYHYENGSFPNALTGITDENGVRFATFAYNGSGKVSSMQNAGGVNNFTVTAYNTNDSVVTNQLGKSTTYNFVNIQGLRRAVQIDGAASTHNVASTRYYNYDQLGRTIGRTDWENNMTRFEYDSRSNITKVIEAQGTALQRVTNISYLSTFNLPDVISEPGKTTDYDYDTYGRLTSKTVTDTATAATRVWAYTYYSNTTDGSGNTILGHLHEIDGPRTDVADVTEFTYDANLDLATITNPLGQLTTVSNRDSAGRPTEITDANSVVTRLTYDTNGRIQTAVRAYGTALAATTTFTYDDNGNITQVTLPNSVTVDYTYDSAQRLTGVEDALGNTIAYTLDDAGNATTVDVNNTTPAVTYTHDRAFDELSRLIQSIGAATPAQTANFAYDKNSNLTTYTDPKTNATANTYDALQRVSTSTNALSGVTTLGYTSLDDVNSVKDQRNNTTTYTYNAFGDVTGETSPDRGTLSYTVDKAGNVTQRTDARSVVTNFTYDALDRVLTVAYPSDSSLNATLTYDSSSGCGTAYRGHLCSVADATGTTTYVYDVLGRVTSASENRGGGLTLATSYTYDLAGNIATITLPSGRVVTYTRNGNGQVTTVAAPVNGSSVNLASGITYLPFGPLNALTYGNSKTLSATFDTDYNPTNRTISGGIANWTYTTDKNSNVTQAGATTYGYDALNRVNAENAGAATSYTYDATSNRLTKVQGGTTSTTVPSGNNKISAVGGTSYTYDAAGNITAIGTSGYVWSAAGLMKEYKISGVSTATYTYNAYNQRTKKVTGGTTTHYVYGAGGLLYGEYTTAGALVREYIYLNGEPLAQVTAGSPETVAYLHTDHLGTPRFGTNSGGSSVWAWNNDAFGVSSPTGSATVNLRMAGQYYDSESALFYNWNRYYNPAIGRYISSDPIGLAGGQLNTFGYVGQNPVMWSDPMGLETPSVTLNFPPDSPAYPQLNEAGAWIFGGSALVGGAILLPEVGGIITRLGGRAAATEGCAYETAAAGGKHAGTLSNYAGRTTAEIQKAIASYEKQVALHLQKIANPAQYAENWATMTAQQRAGLLAKWRADATRNQELADVLQGLLGMR